jgi:hypothetical protein
MMVHIFIILAKSLQNVKSRGNHDICMAMSAPIHTHSWNVNNGTSPKGEMSENLSLMMLRLVAWIKKIFETIIFSIWAAAVLLALSQSKKLIPYILLLTIMVIDL